MYHHRDTEARRTALKHFDKGKSDFSVSLSLQALPKAGTVPYFWASVVKKAVKEKGGFIDEKCAV